MTGIDTRYFSRLFLFCQVSGRPAVLHFPKNEYDSGVSSAGVGTQAACLQRRTAASESEPRAIATGDLQKGPRHRRPFFVGTQAACLQRRTAASESEPGAIATGDLQKRPSHDAAFFVGTQAACLQRRTAASESDREPLRPVIFKKGLVIDGAFFLCNLSITTAPYTIQVQL
jgi:hypothetical protein